MEQEREEELDEKDFVRASNSRDPLPLWMWVASLVALGVLIWGISSWFYIERDRKVGANPFLQVTNREMSLFLWQFPHLMRQHVRNRTGYLPGFDYVDRIGIAEGVTEKYVAAPPELLFLYHTWNRQVKREFSPRAIPRVEFIQFLDYMPEWLPENWPAATQGYRQLVGGLGRSELENLVVLSDSELPKDVRIAFQGWKNYFFEGLKINNIEVTEGEMHRFLKGHPHYARNYWKNVVAQEYPHYLDGMDRIEQSELLPPDQVAPFLRQAYYNSIAP